MQNLKNKKALVIGVANKRSIAWGIAKKLKEYGAEVSISYQNDKLFKRVAPLAEEISAQVYQCDLLDSNQVDKLFKEIGEIDILVHAVAFTSVDALQAPFSEISREDFKLTFEASVYSLIELSRHALKVMKNGTGSILTISYLGSQRVMSGYGIMGPAKAALEASVKYLASEFGEKGIRVNAISAGPIKTLSSTAFGNFNKVLNLVETHTPLKKNISIDDVGELASFLASDGGKMITGETIYIDSGAHMMGL